MVTPVNSTHIKVSWINAFENCEIQDIAEILLNVNNGKNNVPLTTLTSKEAYLSRSPCFRREVIVKLKLTDGGTALYIFRRALLSD